MAEVKKSFESFDSIDDHIEKVLLDARRVYLCDAVTGRMATEVIRKLWYLDLTQPGKPITLVISSPGGAIDAGFAIWDQVQMLESPITTLVTGLAASMGSVLSLCAKKGRRFATPKARIMIHQPSIQGELQAAATDLEIQAREILRTRDHLIEIYVQATSRSVAEITNALDRDKWMSAQEALEFGLLDKIVTRFDAI
jgi:ATP-dependent Clp protease protease subunit